MKTAEEILESKGLSPEDMAHYKIWDYVVAAMKIYAIQAVDRCAEVGFKENGGMVYTKIMNVKQELK